MKKLLTALAVTAAIAAPAMANTDIPPAQHIVEMWNKDPEDRKRRMVFSQELLRVQPGDTILFSATDKGHNVEFVDGPDGVELPKRSRMNKDVEIVLDKPGVYAYVCTPHATMGMIGVIVVGEPTQAAVDAVRDAKMRGKSKRKYKELLQQIP